MLFKTVTSTIKNSSNQARKLAKAISSLQNLEKKIKKLKKIRVILKNSGKNLKTVVMPCKERRQSKILKKNGVVALNLKDNASNFCKFSSNLAYSLLKKPPRIKIKFGIKITEEYYEQMRKECEEFVLQHIDVTTIDKILKDLDVAK